MITVVIPKIPPNVPVKIKLVGLVNSKNLEGFFILIITSWYPMWPKVSLA